MLSRRNVVWPTIPALKTGRFKSFPAASRTMIVGVMPSGVVPLASKPALTSVRPVTVGAVPLVELPDHVAENGAAVIVCVGT